MAHICHLLLRRHNIFLLGRNMGAHMPMDGPVMQHCCCSAAGSQTHHSRRELSTEWILFGCVQFNPLSWYLLWEETSVSRERALCISPALWTVDPADCYWLDASQQTHGARSCGIIIRPNAKNCWLVEIRWFTVNTSRNWRLCTGWIKLRIYTVHQKAVSMRGVKQMWHKPRGHSSVNML